MTIKNRPTRTLLATGTIVALLLTGCNGSPDGGAADDIEPTSLVWSEIQAADSAAGRSIQEFFKAVDKETGGKVTFEPFYSASLLNGPEQLKGLQSGIADVAAPSPTNFPTDMPVGNWANVLHALLPEDPLEQILVSTLVINELYLTNKDLQEEMRGLGIKPLSFYGTTTSDMYCVNPIDDATGLRVRTAGEPVASAYGGAGMISVNLPSVEVYEALQRGVVDCVSSASGLQFYRNLGVHDVAPHFYATLAPSLFGTGKSFNLQRWESLPSSAQQVIENEMAKWLSEYLHLQFEALAEAAADPKVKFEDPTKLNASIRTKLDEILDKALSSPPSTLTDPEALVQEYKDLVKKWHPRVQEIVGDSPSTGLDPAEALRQRYINGPGTVDWDAFSAALTEAQQAQ